MAQDSVKWSNYIFSFSKREETCLSSQLCKKCRSVMTSKCEVVDFIFRKINCKKQVKRNNGHQPRKYYVALKSVLRTFSLHQGRLETIRVFYFIKNPTHLESTILIRGILFLTFFADSSKFDLCNISQNWNTKNEYLTIRQNILRSSINQMLLLKRSTKSLMNNITEEVLDLNLEQHLRIHQNLRNCTPRNYYQKINAF